MGKSSEIQLKNRGEVKEADLNSYINASKEEIIALLNSKEAFKRTIAARLLSDFEDIDNSIIVLLCEKLACENKLYTKIEICNSLSKFGIHAVNIMVNYLGKIGKNQYIELPIECFNKKSYPLPRDIIARTLAHMDKKILPQLTYILRSDNIIAIREVIDAIGFICFYDKTDYPLTELKKCFNEKGHDDIIRWKIIRAFGSFNDKEVIEILKTVKKYDIKEIIQKEAERSLHIIEQIL